jgi:hypothetical protein
LAQQTHSAYGFALYSTVSLGLAAAAPPPGAPVVTVDVAPRERDLRAGMDARAEIETAPGVAARWYSGDGDAVVVEHSSIARCRVARTPSGARIQVQPAGPLPAVARFVKGLPCAYAACLVGYLPLLAVAMELCGGAVLVAGASGVGKSTLLFECVRRGARVVADDLAAIDAMAPPGPAVFSSSDPLVPARGDGWAAGVLLPRNAYVSDGSALPIHAVVFLQRGPQASRPEIAPISGVVAASVALASLFCGTLMAAERHGEALGQIARLVAEAGCYKLTLPNGLEHGGAAAESLLQLVRPKRAAAAPPSTVG